MFSRVLPPVLVLTLLMAGCSGSSTEEIIGRPGAASFNDSRGAIHGTVTDESLLPIPGALVAIEGRDDVATTEDDGSFSFSLLEPGVYRLSASAEGYGESAASAEVIAGYAASVSLRLTALASTEPYMTTTLGTGRLGCGMAVAVRPAALSQPANWCGTGTDFAYYGAPQLNDKYHVAVPIAATDPAQLETIVFETAWQSNQAFSSGFRSYWYIEGKVSGIPRVWDYYADLGDSAGRSPIRFSMDREAIESILLDADPSMVQKCAVVTDCHWGAAVFPYADTLGDSSPVDFSLYVDQAFTHYVSEFIGAPPLEGFTALADA